MPELRLRTSWDDQTYVLHDGRADVSYIRLPVDQSGLQVQALLAEPRAAVFPASHRLAGKDTISIADLAGEHLLQDPAAVPEWRDIAAEMRSRDRASVPAFRTVEEKLEHVAAGHGIVVLPLSTAVFYTRPGVALQPRQRHRAQPGVPGLGRHPAQPAHPGLRRRRRGLPARRQRGRTVPPVTLWAAGSRDITVNCIAWVRRRPASSATPKPLVQFSVAKLSPARCPVTR
jgi:hypothetical protein